MSWFAWMVYGALAWKERRLAKRAHGATPGRESEAQAQHLEVGARGETLAYWFLRRSGYVIVARNRRPRSRRGELDIVGWDGPVLAFIEVKTRSGTEAGLPEQAVTRDQQGRIVQSAKDYMRRLKRQPTAYRFDIASVAWDPDAGYRVRVIKDAFKG